MIGQTRAIERCAVTRTTIGNDESIAKAFDFDMFAGKFFVGDAQFVC